MMVPRAFSYSWNANVQAKTEKTAPRSVPKSQGEQVRRFGWRPSSYESQIAVSPSTTLRRSSIPSTAREPRDISSSVKPEGRQGASKPVAVPIRAHRIAKSPPHANKRGCTSEQNVIYSNLHNSDALAPSVAALLAMTQIPKPTSRRQKKRLTPSTAQMSATDLAEEWRHVYSTPKTFGTSPIDVLLSPPEDVSFEEAVAFDTPLRSSRTRSSSTDSTPSLLADDASSFNSDDPPTPGSELRRLSARERKGSPTQAIECDFDHPLLDDEVESIETNIEATPFTKASDSAPSQRPSRFQKPLARFRSNLTASISQLRLAARSISNFAATAIPPDDHIARGLMGPASPFRSELRPNPMLGTPTPELRRYLNPFCTSSLAPQEFHLHNYHLNHHDPYTARSVPLDENALPMVIPLRTYSRGANSGSERCASTAPVVVVAPAPRAQRLREPRENNEFLRIYVLEAAMRRQGKLEAQPLLITPGRKAFWLPARSMRLGYEEVEVDGVPSRWVGVCCDEAETDL